MIFTASNTSRLTKLALVLTLLLSCGARAGTPSPGAELFVRAPGQSADDFALSSGPADKDWLQRHNSNPDDAQLRTAEVALYRDGPKAVAAFYYALITEELGSYQHVRAYLYVPEESDPSRYRRVFLRNIEPDGGSPVVEQVFLMGAAGQTPQTLGITASWNQRHYDNSGIVYDTYLFDYTPAAVRQGKLSSVERFRDKFWGCECTHGFRTGNETVTHAKFILPGSVHHYLRAKKYPNVKPIVSVDVPKP